MNYFKGLSLKQPIILLLLVYSSLTYALPISIPPDTISSNEKFVDLSYYLEKPFTWMYGEKKAKFIGFEKLLFSPDGKYLAFSISQITCGNAEQLWIMDLANKRCRLVTEPVIEKKIGIHIDDFKWISNTLLKVHLQRINWPNQNMNRRVVLVADMDRVNEIRDNSIVNYVAEYFKNNRSAFFDLSFSKDYSKIFLKNLQTGKKSSVLRSGFYLDDSPFSYDWTPDGKHFVFTNEPQHRVFELFLGVTQPRFKIISLAVGSWELFDYAMSPYSSEIAFPTFWGHEIILYNTDKLIVDRIIKTGKSPERLAWSTDKKIAYVSTVRILIELKRFDRQKLYLVDVR
jgi:Tol biopolymer transport system component